MKDFVIFLAVVVAAMATVNALPPLGNALANARADPDPVSDSSLSYSSDSSTDDSFTDDSSTDPSDLTDPTEETTPTTTENPGGGNNGLTDGEIAGIVIGSIAGVALIGGGIYYMKVKGMLCFG